jgi:hypothetical protein
MNESSHRDSFKMHGIEYEECFKAVSLWLKDLKVLNQNDTDNQEAHDVEHSDSSYSDQNVSLGSIGVSDDSNDDTAIND